jgi:hypothetical protein
MYQAPAKTISNYEIIKKLNFDWEIYFQKFGVYDPYFELQVEVKDRKDIDRRINVPINNNFEEIDKLVEKLNPVKVYIWSGFEFCILNTRIYNDPKTKTHGYVIKKRNEYDLLETNKIYSIKEIESFIENIIKENKHLIVDNTIEKSWYKFQTDKYKSAKEMFDTRDKYTLL